MFFVYLVFKIININSFYHFLVDEAHSLNKNLQYVYIYIYTDEHSMMTSVHLSVTF